MTFGCRRVLALLAAAIHGFAAIGASAHHAACGPAPRVETRLATATRAGAQLAPAEVVAHDECPICQYLHLDQAPTDRVSLARVDRAVEALPPTVPARPATEPHRRGRPRAPPRSERA